MKAYNFGSKYDLRKNIRPLVYIMNYFGLEIAITQNGGLITVLTMDSRTKVVLIDVGNMN